MTKFRSKEVVEATVHPDGYEVVCGDGNRLVFTEDQFRELYQPLNRVLDWRGSYYPGPGRLYDANGVDISETSPLIFYADLDSGMVATNVKHAVDGRTLPTGVYEIHNYPAPLKFIPIT